MHTRNKTTTLLVFFVILFSCSKEDEIPTPTPQDTSPKHSLHSVPGLANFINPYVNIGIDLNNKTDLNTPLLHESSFSQAIDYTNIQSQKDEEGFVNYAMHIKIMITTHSLSAILLLVKTKMGTLKPHTF